MATSPSTQLPPPPDGSLPTNFQWKYGEGDARQDKLHGGGIVILTVLSIALFLIILYLYTHRWFQFRRTPPAVSDYADGVVTFPSGLTMKVVDGLEVRQNRHEEAECSICLSKLLVGEIMKFMPGCDHGFHKDCVDEWLKSHPTCPLCRRLLLGLPTGDLLDVV